MIQGFLLQIKKTTFRTKWGWPNLVDELKLLDSTAIAGSLLYFLAVISCG